MNRLSSQQKNITRLVLLALAISLLCSACLDAEMVTKAEPTRSTGRFDFQQYGYEVSGFTSDQEQIIAWTLAAYGRALGGPEKLRQIIRADNHGQNREITYAPDLVGANAAIKLSSTVFSLEKSYAANYSSYAAPNDVTHARIVISHEINHILFRAVKARTSIDWAKVYQQRVQRDWARIQDPTAPEQEAVTEFGLKIQSQHYYFSLGSKQIETNSEIISEIDSWAIDFLSALENM